MAVCVRGGNRFQKRMIFISPYGIVVSADCPLGRVTLTRPEGGVLSNISALRRKVRFRIPYLWKRTCRYVIIKYRFYMQFRFVKECSILGIAYSNKGILIILQREVL